MMIDQEDNLDKKGGQRLSRSIRSSYQSLFGHKINIEKERKVKYMLKK
jgi:hypothetical protein